MTKRELETLRQRVIRAIDKYLVKYVKDDSAALFVTELQLDINKIFERYQNKVK